MCQSKYTPTVLVLTEGDPTTTPNYSGVDKEAYQANKTLYKLVLGSSTLTKNILHVKTVVAQRLRQSLPSAYHVLAKYNEHAIPPTLPMTVRSGSWTSSNYTEGHVIDEVTVYQTLRSMATDEEDAPYLFVDLTNEGPETANSLLGMYFNPPAIRSASSTTHCTQGRFPRELVPWSDFKESVRAHNRQPAITPPHRTRYMSIPHIRGKPGYLESAVERFIENTTFLSLNEIYKGTNVEYALRGNVAVIGEPGCILLNGRKTIVPIEAKSLSVISADTEFSEVLDDLAVLQQTSEHRYHKLTESGKKKWDSIVSKNSTLKTLIQIYGYSCANKSRYSILTNAASFWFFRRDETGRCEFTQPLKMKSQDPTVNECLNYIAAAALSSPEIPSPSSMTDPEIIPPSRGPSQIIGCKGTNASAVLLTKEGAQSIDERDIILNPGTEAHSGRFCKICRCTVRYEDLAMKILDRFKCPPEALASLQNELDIYGDLITLQGVVIPRVLAFGTLVNGAMAFLATSWEDGHELGEMDSDKKLLGNVRVAYQKLHEAGVLHNDVAERNIIVLHNQEIRIVDFDCATKRPTNAEKLDELDSVERMFRRM